MTIKNLNQDREIDQTEVGVWFCQSCGCFQVKAGEILLTLTGTEFSDFTDSAAERLSQNA